MPYRLTRTDMLAFVIALLITSGMLPWSHRASAQLPSSYSPASRPAAGALSGTAGAVGAVGRATPAERDSGARSGQWLGSDATRLARQEAIQAIPLGRLTPAAQGRITAITNRPTLYRHLPQQTIQCDPELFLFVVRHPEVLVGIWELMEITEVQTQRVGDYQLRAVDGSGTDCTVDLVYGDSSVHVFVADGFYDGKLIANPVHGKGVFVLRSEHRSDAKGNPVIEGTLDCFVQVEHLAADLIIRTFGPLIGRTADNNFAETARFVDPLGQSARSNPAGMEELARRLPQVSDPVRNQFAASVRNSAQRYHNRSSLHRAADPSPSGLSRRP